MRIEGKVFKGNKIIRVIDSSTDSYVPAAGAGELRFNEQLEYCLLHICHELNVSPPLWMQKNTKEFARFHQTFFTAEQFVEPVVFDRLLITWIDDGRNI